MAAAGDRVVGFDSAEASPEGLSSPTTVAAPVAERQSGGKVLRLPAEPDEPPERASGASGSRVRPSAYSSGNLSTGGISARPSAYSGKGSNMGSAMGTDRPSDQSFIGAPDYRGTNLTAMTGMTANSMSNLGHIDDDDDEPIPWSASYVLACLILPLINGCLSKSFWPCFTLYYVKMSWPLWRCGLAISLGAIVHCLMQKTMDRAGLWSCMPFALVHLIFAILALVFVNEEWAIFAEMVCLLGLDAKVAIEGVAYDWFLPRENFALQASAGVITSFAVSHVLSFSLGAIIYETTSWEGIAVFHLSSQGLIFLLLLVSPPCWRSLKKFSSGRDSSNRMKSVMPEEDDKMWEIRSVDEDRGPSTRATQVNSLTSPEDRSDRSGILKNSGSSAPSAPGELGEAERKTPPPRQTQVSANARQSKFSSRQTMVSQKSRDERGSVMSVQMHVKGNRQSSFLVSTRVTTRRTTNYSSAQRLKSRTSNWSQRASTVELHAVEGRFVVDKDLRLALARRSSQHWGIQEVDFDYRFPMTLVACTNWATHFSMVTQLVTCALLLSRAGWSNVIWVGLVQSGGEVLVIIATLVKGCFNFDEEIEAVEEDEDGHRQSGLMDDEDMPQRSCLSRCLFILTSEPYNVTVYLLIFAAINFCLIIPEVAGIVVAQVLFSTTYAFADKAAHDMYVLYSCFGNPDMLYTVVSLGYAGAVIGGLMAGVLTLWLYDLQEEFPFLVTGGVCVMVCVQYTAGFCCRVGTDILTAEADRE